MSIIETGFKAASIIIGVDTHKSTHVAVAINEHGARLSPISIPANSKGYVELNENLERNQTVASPIAPFLEKAEI